MPKTVHCSAIVTTWLLSVAVLISAAQFDVAQAKKGRAAGLRQRTSKTLRRHASASKQYARVPAKEPRKTSPKMRCTRQQCCAQL